MVSAQFEQFDSQRDSAIFRIIIYSVVHLPTDFSLGIKKHIQILTGSTSSLNIDHMLGQHKTYGALFGYSEKTLEIYFDSLYEGMTILSRCINVI